LKRPWGQDYTSRVEREAAGVKKYAISAEKEL